MKAQLRGERRRAAGLTPLATHLSQRERAAMAAERQMHALKAAVLMEGRRGEVAEGLVSGIIPQGVFVTLIESGLDGYLPARALEFQALRPTAEVFQLSASTGGGRDALLARIIQVLPKTTWHANDPPVGLANASPGKLVQGIARRQQAKMWELRATVSLCRFWQAQGQFAAAVDAWPTNGGARGAGAGASAGTKSCRFARTTRPPG